MNTVEIKKAIEEKLIGTEFSTYFGYSVVRAISTDISDEDYRGLYFKEVYGERNSIYVMYKNHYLMKVTLKKQKGSYSGYGHYHWTVVVVETNTFGINENDDLVTALRKIDVMVDDTKKKEHEEMVEKANLIKKMASDNGMTTEEFFDLVNYINDMRYEIKAEIRNSAK